MAKGSRKKSRSVRFTRGTKKGPSTARNRTRTGTLQGHQPPKSRSFGFQTAADVNDAILAYSIPRIQEDSIASEMIGRPRKLSQRSKMLEKYEDIGNLLQDRSIAQEDMASYISSILLSGGSRIRYE